MKRLAYWVVGLLVAAYDDERIEVKCRTLRPIDRVVAVGVISIRNTVGVAAIGGKRKDIGGPLHHESGSAVEDVLTEIEDKHGEDEIEAALFGILVNYVSDTFIKEFNLVDNPGADGRVVLQHFFQVKGVRNTGNVVSRYNITASIGN